MLKKGDSIDPYAFEDNLREVLGKSGDIRDLTKSAKTVMKRNHNGLLQPRIVDFSADPLALGIRPSTAI
jgi:hypothetical protein